MNESNAFDLDKMEVSTLKTFNEYRQTGEQCDVTIVQYGIRIQAHKMILSSASAYFKALFTINMKEANMDEITIPGISYDTMEHIIEYIYTGEIVITTDNAQSIILAADYLQMTQLVDISSRYLVKQLDRDNCLSMRQLLVSMKCDKDIIDMATIYVTAYFVPITKSIEFIELNIEGVVELLSFNQLYIDNEQDVYDSGMRWLYAKSDRYVYADRILKCIRLHLLPLSFLKMIVLPDCVFRSEVCQKLIKQVIQYQSNDLEPSTKSKFIPLSNRKCTTIPGYVTAFQGCAVDEIRCEIFDRSSDTWSDNYQVDLFEVSQYMASHNGHMYIAGDVMSRFPTVEKLDMKTKEITTLTSSNPLYMMGCATVFVGNNMYVLGGNSEINDRTTSNISVFYIDRNYWELGYDDMLKRRSYCAAIGLGHHVYVCGGECDDDDTPSSSVERFDTITKLWEYIAPMNEERAECGICVYNGRIYVAGGIGKKQASNTFEVYDPVMDTWTLLEPMKIERSSFSLVATLNGIYAVAGESETRKLSSVEYYSYIDKKWKEVAPLDHIEGNVISCVVPTHPYQL